ncbi:MULTISPECIES: oligosaccharide flippase family protein [Haloferax]|uniref:Oligosaccharide flippase family protein n=2 Tax=Haloferax TaxID=2251 RepID=A0A6G1Z739_9EURY|nr:MULTISPECIES: oligosaccharide flippase family protein [Haloferax]KAB1185474.1 oligosaccharide flippase family protein [Haloferax sp. CBA1149]MRW82124.1 oligosaccharide flippase family protein [Haloferax marinisediminis]
MDLGESTFRLFIAKVGKAVLMFAAITYFARVLGASQLGSFFLFFAAQGLLSIPADMGMRGALEKRLSEGENFGEKLSSALLFKLVLLVFVSIGIYLARDWLNGYFGANLAMLLIVAVVGRELSLLYIQAVRGELRVAETAPIELGRRLVWVVIGSVLISNGYGVEGVIYGLIISSAVALVWAYAKCSIRLERPSLEQMRSLLAYSKFDIVTSVGGRVYQFMDTAIIGFFLAQQFVGAYEVAWQVTLLVLMLSSSISLTIFPQISRWSSDSAVDQIGSTITTALAFSVFASVPALVGAIIYSEEILQYIFGPEYVIASLVLIVLMFEKLVQSVNDIVGISVRAINRPDLAAKATVISIGINLLLSPILILTVGFVGAAIATGFSWLVNTALHTRYLRQSVTFEFPVRLFGWYTFASVIMGVSLLAIKSAVPVTGIAILVIQVAIGAVLYVAVSLVVPDIRRQIISPALSMLSSRFTGTA